MSRSAEDGYRLYEDLCRKDIRLAFLKGHHIDTSTYKKAAEGNISMTGTNVDYILEGINQYMLALAKEQIRLAFVQSQKEVDDLHQRTREGIQTARLNGKQIGRIPGKTIVTKKEKAAKAVILQHSISFGGTLKDTECRKLAGVSKNTFYKYKAQLRDGI